MTRRRVRAFLTVAGLLVPSTIVALGGARLIARVVAGFAAIPFNISALPADCQHGDAIVVCAEVWQLGTVYAMIWTVLMLLAIGAALFSYLSIARRAPRSAQLPSACAALLVGFVLSYALYGPPRLYDSIGHETFARTIVALGYGNRLNISLDLANIVVAWASVVVAVACATSLLDLPRKPPGPLSEEDGNLLMASLRYRLQLLRKLLVLAAALLVAGVAASAAYLSSPMPLIDQATRPAFKAVTDTVVTLQGIHYALLLMCVFFPPAFLISRRADAIARALGKRSMDERADYLSKNGALSAPTGVLDALMASAPLLVAPLANLTKLLALG